MSKVRIEIEDDGRVRVYVGETLVPALVNVDFAHVREGYKAAVLVVGKGDPRAEATIDALLEANGTRVVNPLYIEEDEYKGLQMDNLRKRMTKEMKEEADREVELDRLKLLAVDTLEKELEKDVGYRIAMSGKTPPPYMAAQTGAKDCPTCGPRVTCAHCGATALEGEAEGWRSLTCHDATHQMICPECQKGLEGEDRNPIP